MMEMAKRYMAWADALRQKGSMVGGEKLAAGGVRHIRVKDGKPVASDGPYAEAKDVIGGYFIIEAKDLAEAEASPTIARISRSQHQLGRTPAHRHHDGAG